MTGQPSLELGDLTGPPGRVEQGFTAAVAAARQAQVLEPTDDGMAALAVELGRAVDTAAKARDVRGVATAAKELREAARALRLDPTSRGSAGDAFSDLLRELQSPQSRGTLGHPGQP